MSSITYVEAGPEPEPGTPISKSTFPSICRTAVHLVRISSRCREPDTVKPSRDWWSPPLRARVLPLVHPGADRAAEHISRMTRACLFQSWFLLRCWIPRVDGMFCPSVWPLGMHTAHYPAVGQARGLRLV